MKPLSDDEIIAALREVDVPEPSPLFWDHLSQRVQEAVANEPAPAPGWPSRFNFAWAAGLFGALAVVVLAVVVTMHHSAPAANTQAPPLSSAVLQASDSLPALEDDASWAVMGDLAAQMDFDEAGAAGLIATPGAANRAVGEFSQDEQRAIVDLLQQEIKSSKRL